MDFIKQPFKYSPMENMNTHTPQLTNIAPALIKALAETQDIVADSTNPFHHNKYASLSAHLKALKPIFAKHGLAIVQFPTSVGFDGGVGVKTMILHTSGELIESSISIEAPLKKNKDGTESRGYSGQEAGALLSYLRRYALASVAGVATEDDDAETNRIAGGGELTKANYYSNAPSTQAPVFVKSTPAPQGTPATQGKIDPSLTIPFGRSKGQAIGTLSKDDLKFWAETWEPRPYEKTGRVTVKDATLKATALALFNGEQPEGQQQQDDVPFDNSSPF
jgi:hypothetical protein